MVEWVFKIKSNYPAPLWDFSWDLNNCNIPLNSKCMFLIQAPVTLDNPTVLKRTTKAYISGTKPRRCGKMVKSHPIHRGFHVSGGTPSHPFRTMGYSINFHYKPSVWGYPGYPHSWKPHIINTITTSIQIALRFGFSEHLRSSQEGIFGTRRRSWFPSSAGSSSARGE